MSPTMPDLCTPIRTARHTLHSALPTLTALGVAADRVGVRALGRGWPDGTVVTQDPPPGAVIEPSTRVTLGLAGAGAGNALPWPLRDGTPGAFGAEELLACFDGPLLKLADRFRSGGDWLRLPGDDPATARRWIEEVFGLDPRPWPPSRWPALARLLPALHRQSGRIGGVRLALDLVYGLPVAAMEPIRCVVPWLEGRRTRLGAANTRLGTDAVIGAGGADVVGATIRIGPVQLAEQQRHAAADRCAERQALYRLVVPLWQATRIEEQWLVCAPAALRLSRPGAALGVNSRFPRTDPSEWSVSRD